MEVKKFVLRNIPERNKAWPKVGVVVLNWNRWNYTLECLESLNQSKYSNLSVIVIDNGSTDDSVNKIEAWIKRQPFYDRFLLIKNQENLGFAAGCNIGIRHAISSGCQYIFLLNNDAIVHPNCLSALITNVEKHDRVGIAGPKVYYADNPQVIWFAGGKSSLLRSGGVPFGQGEQDSGQYDTIKQVTFITGAAMLIKREVFYEVGLLDERFFFGKEDYDFCRRALNKGFHLLYVPDAIVWHKVGGTRSNGPIGVYLGYKTNIIFMKKHLPWPIWFCWFWLYAIYIVAVRPYMCEEFKIPSSIFRKAVLLALKEGLFDTKVTREDLKRAEMMLCSGMNI